MKGSYDFKFVCYEFDRPSYTDNRKGCPSFFLGYMEEGRAEIKGENGVFTLAKGDFFYIPMHLPYESRWMGDPVVRFRSIGFTLFPEGEMEGFALQKLPKDPELLEMYMELPLTRTPDAAALSRLYALLARLVPILAKEEKSRSKRLVQETYAFFSLHPEKSVSDAARHSAVSVSALYQAFRHLGVTPNEMRLELLSEKAVRILSSTNRSVQDISDSLGFSSPSYFRKVLKKYQKKTPRDIRKAVPKV